MQSHIGCLYDFLKRRHDNQLPSSFHCFICSMDLPLVALSIHPPPSSFVITITDDDDNDDDDEIKEEPRTFANFSSPTQDNKFHQNNNNNNKNKNNKNKTRDKHILHPEFYQNKHIPLQTSLMRFFDSSNKRSKS